MTTCVEGKCCIMSDRVLVASIVTSVYLLRRWQQFCGPGWLQGPMERRQQL